MIFALAVLAVLAERTALPEPHDDELVSRYRDGDPDAFEAIYRAHVSAVYRRLTRILGPVAEREDLTQDVFLALHGALPRFRGEARLSTLVHRIAINKAYEHLRRRTRRPAIEVDDRFFEQLAGDGSSPEQRVCAREDLVLVLECLARIKPKKRIALLLRMVDGLSFEEIGELVDAEPDAVAKRVQHGQRELDDMLARRLARRSA